LHGFWSVADHRFVGSLFSVQSKQSDATCVVGLSAID